MSNNTPDDRAGSPMSIPDIPPHSEFVVYVNGTEHKRIKAHKVVTAAYGLLFEEAVMVPGMGPSTRIVYTMLRPSDTMVEFEELLMEPPRIVPVGGGISSDVIPFRRVN